MVRRRLIGQHPGMADRDIEKDVPKSQFVETLRRLADAVESGEPFRIQIAGKRFQIPRDASLVIEHEVEGGDEEVSLELQWKSGG
jgi:amphi-Trp domain-containing protein